MDLNKLGTNDWLIGGGWVVFLVGGIFNWFSWDFGDDVFGIDVVDVSASGFDASWRFWVPLLFGLATALVAIIPKLSPNLNLPELPISWGQLTAGLGVATGVFAVLGFLAKPSGSSWSFGIFISLVGAAGVVVGAILELREIETASREGQQPPQPF
ncbi:MAG: hypothetical protein JJLCMIEE_01023 [Acidimicrobiales bacterium]|nr:MAG: hypothetical protein EDR02_07540 [Actinomycetota bacterium]MBV6507965.1 hypothetical protein [Acidimicrobiales bacterium]RIK06938.1 MAG: hypothetical protein DCC48_05480 [Acidobacteriota bacterium]